MHSDGGDDDGDDVYIGSLYVICPYADTRGPMPRPGYWTSGQLGFFGPAISSSSSLLASMMFMLNTLRRQRVRMHYQTNESK